MLVKPNWVKLLLSGLRPDEKRISQLEKLRLACDIPHEPFSLRILSSPVTTRRVQRNCLEYLTTNNPYASEKELLRMVLISRIQSPPVIKISEKEIDQAMKNINSFDELCDYIIQLGEKEPSFLDPFSIGEVIDEILAEEEAENTE